MPGQAVKSVARASVGMRTRLVLPVVAAALLAGCASGLGPAAGPSTTEQPTTTFATTADRLPYPDPPDELTNESAKRVALDHEEASVHDRLRNASDVDSFSVRANTTTYVDADGSTDAVYFVSEATVERVRGDEVSP